MAGFRRSLRVLSPEDKARIEAELENIDGVLARVPAAESLPDLSELELTAQTAP